MRAGVTTGALSDARSKLGFPVFSVVQTTPGAKNTRVRVRLGMDYRGLGNDYLSPIPFPPGTYVRPPFQDASLQVPGSKSLLANYWPSPSQIAAVNAGCAAGASVFGFKCKTWADEMARFVEARRASGWCMQTMSAPSGVGAGTVQSVRVPVAGQSLTYGVRTVR